ncbi:extracellular solute-binding protein [uncultured Acetatifactor sp.]|uniref:extracellular solute-binding protein n=1 Tax=uncultured Acetatifactor sp. TaxID=1671927 RepID=UPI0026264BCB|nr:extracellular solute-binding protein [uncultured Acetatifactor sp.]
MKKSTKKRWISAVLVAIMTAGSLAACGGEPASTDSSAPEGKTEESSETPAESDSEEADEGGEAEGEAEAPAGDGAKTAEELLLEPYPEPVDIHVVLQYRESENPDTPTDATPENSTAVKLLKEELNINLIYDWIVNADQYSQKFGAELAAGNVPDIVMLGNNDFEDLTSQGGLLDLTEAYEMYTCPDLENIYNFDGNFINVGKKDGKLYGLPVGSDPAQMTSQMYYDMNQLKDVGITSAEQLPKTIEEFEALCDKLMEATGGPVLPACKNYFGAQLGDFTPFFHAYETWVGGWIDNNGTLEYAGISEKNKDVLTKLNEWYNKGYFKKDFAAYDIWAADSQVVSDIVAGKYAIVPGSWWIPNWPLNSNKVEHPEADWIVGPNLSLDGEQPAILIDRYPVNSFIGVGLNCEHPEAVFKVMYWSLQYTVKNSPPEVQNAMTEEEKTEWNSYVYTWVPWRIYSPTCLRTNFEVINQYAKEGKTEIAIDEAPRNNEFWGSWSSYLKYVENPDDGVAWGTYFSRLAENGGVDNMIKTVESADIIYNEVYVTTPSMITKQGELDKLRDNTFISMIMGETPIDEFDTFVEQWKAQGGEDITNEVNEWYQSK